MALVNAAGTGSPQAAAILNEPTNAPLFERYAGIPELVTPGCNPVEKQKKEIQLLLQSSPIPKPAYIAYQLAGTLQAAATGTPTPDPKDVFGSFPADQLPNLFDPSIGIDPFSDESQLAGC